MEAKRAVKSSVRGPPRTRTGAPTLSTMSLRASIERAIELGVRGVVLGRNVWQNGDPGLVVKELIKVVHGRY
jgi:DhnA family fructose-bisphosphate aldolase class Ia